MCDGEQHDARGRPGFGYAVRTPVALRATLTPTRPPGALRDTGIDFDCSARAGAPDAGAATLRFRATTRPDEVFDRFHAAYDRAFILPDEKEDRDGLIQCLALNHGARYEALAARYGPYREWVAVLEEDGEVAGGANLVCHPLRGGGGASGPWLLAANLNYVFVTASHRGRGHLHRLVAACRRLVEASFVPAPGTADPATMPLLLFFELNDPLRMDPEDYALDSAHAGVDQFDRVAIWGRLGARIMDFPYLQPPLSAGQAADDGLLLGVIGAPDAGLDACTLGGHLERFFSISVLKGLDARGSPASRGQLELCEAACAEGRPFALLDPQPHLDALRRMPAGGSTRTGLRAALSRGRG